MALADFGIAVDLYDRNETSMTQASLQNEGKIHLGYVYGNDPSLLTAAKMVRGSATFGPLLERWLEISRSEMTRSAPFNYAVHRDSLLTVDDVARHLAATHAMVVENLGGGEYFGLDVTEPPRRLNPEELNGDYDTDLIQAVFETEEVSIDPADLARHVRIRVDSHPKITCLFETTVLGATITDAGVEVRSQKLGIDTSETYDQVVNALWDGRIVLDQSMGLGPDDPWLFRVKYYLRLEAPGNRLPSTTFVLGPYGDVVDYGSGVFYLSWYPAGLIGLSSLPEFPRADRELTEGQIEAMSRDIVAGLASVMPGVERIAVNAVQSRIEGGVIFAWGETDIDDSSSGLHKRFSIGPTSHGPYHTIDTGKLTTAPLHAQQLASRIRATL